MPKTPKRVEFYVCDHCGKPIAPENKYEGAGLIVTGQIKTIDPDGFTNIVGGDFPQTKAFTIGDVDQSVFHTHCLIDVLGNERTVEEEEEDTEEQEDEEEYPQPLYVIRTKNSSKEYLFWNSAIGAWVKNIDNARRYHEKEYAERRIPDLNPLPGYGKPHIWKLTEEQK